MVPPKRISVKDLIQLLEIGIMSGKHEAGSLLPSERSLAATYQVGRPLVREALRSLAGRGLVQISPGRGAFVRDAEEFGQFSSIGVARRTTPRQVVETRIALESPAARLAAKHASPDQVELMETTLKGLVEATDSITQVRLDLAFHLTIARSSQNPLLAGLLHSLAPLMVQLMMRSIWDSWTAKRSGPKHQECFEAIKQGDGTRAANAMASHLRVAEDTFGEEYDSPLDVTTSIHAQTLVAKYGSIDALVAAVLERPTESES